MTVPGVPCIARRSADDGSCPAADSDTLAMLLQAPPVEKGTSHLTYSKCSDVCPEFSDYYDPNRDIKDPEQQQVGLFECRTFNIRGYMKEEYYCVENI